MEESNRPRQQRYQQQSHQHHHHQKSKKIDNNNKNKNKKPLVIIGVLVLLVAVTAFGYHEVHKRKVLNLLAQEGIYQGITINGEDVSGLSQEEAVAQLQERYKSEVVGQILTLQYGEEDALQKWDIPFEDIGAGYHVEDAVKEAYETGRTGTEADRFQVGAKLLKDGVNIELTYGYDAEMLSAKLDEVAEEFNQDAIDSTVVRQNGRFVVSPEQTGL